MDIFTKEQVAAPEAFEKVLHGSVIASITLYDQLAGLPRSDEFAEAILLRFKDGRAAFKATYRNRFGDFDQRTCELIKAHLECGACVVHDMGVSDARTAVDFYRTIQRHGVDADYYASDLGNQLLVVRDGCRLLVLDGDGKPLELVWPPFVLRLIQRESYRFNFLKQAAWVWANYVLVPRMLALHAAGRFQTMYSITLVCEAARRLAEQDTRFHLLKHNILDKWPLPAAAHVIRAMNILNPSYFSTKELQTAIARIGESLQEGGLFITGSNQEAQTLVHGGVYQKTANAFKRLWTSGDGSPFHAEITRTVLFP